MACAVSSRWRPHSQMCLTPSPWTFHYPIPPFAALSPRWCPTFLSAPLTHTPHICPPRPRWCPTFLSAPLTHTPPTCPPHPRWCPTCSNAWAPARTHHLDSYPGTSNPTRPCPRRHLFRYSTTFRWWTTSKTSACQPGFPSR